MGDASGSLRRGSSSARLRRGTEELAAAVRQHLARILESPSFQGSRRCQEFLQYVVERALAGEFDALKERVIGAEVFGRPAGYETSGDAIVRVKANEVRKRLAQYYQDSGGAEVLRIELPAGSYVPTLTWLDEKGGAPVVVLMNNPEPEQPPVPFPAGKAQVAGRFRGTRWLAAGLGVILLAAIGLWRLVPRPSELERFWRPVLDSGGAVVLCMVARDDYILSARMSEALEAGAQKDGYHLDLRLQADDVVRVPNGQMSFLSLRAVLDLAMFLARNGKQVQFRTPADVSFDDILHGAVILVGGVNNPWSRQLGQESRYSFDSIRQGSRAISWIRDAKAPDERKWVVEGVWPYHAQPVEYAIISRVFNSANQRVIVSAAGLTRIGSRVASEFLTAPKYWESVAAQAPRGWERMNCQIILETKLVGTTPGPPKIAATHFW